MSDQLPPDGMPVIDVRDLTKTYTSYRQQPGFVGVLRSLIARERITVEAVRGISFTVAAGECVGFLGPNGAGKTTTLKMLSGILWPSSGTARVLGCTPWERPRDYLREMSLIMGQKNQLWWDLPAMDGFRLNQAIYGIPNNVFSERVRTLTDTLDVGHLLEIPIRKLSLGERMKCELVNALLHAPKVLFLDEPTIGLDVVAQHAIRDFLREWNRRERTTMILTSHQMADVEALCARVIIIDHGALRYDGTIQRLVAATIDHQELRVTFRNPVERHDVERLGTLVEYAALRARLDVPRSEVASVVKMILDRFPVDALSIDDAPLEEVIRRFYGSGGSPSGVRS